jgi:hypothetical protein
MSKSFAKDKGARAERNVIQLLQPIVDKVYSELGKPVPKLQRNSLQSDGGGFDIVGLDWIALEVKHQEKMKINDWWAQTIRQATDGNITNRLPVLFYKSNGLKWHVMMEGLVEIEKDFWSITPPDGLGMKLGIRGRKVRCPVTISQESFLVFFEHKLRLEASK